MALELHAFIKGDLPDHAAWQAAIDGMALPVSLDPDLEPPGDSGFLPCTLQGQPSGFEIYFERADELVRTYPGISRQIGEGDWAITFRWGGDLQECACAMAAAAGLIACSNARVYFPDDGQWFDIAGLRSGFQDCLSG